MMGDKGDSGRWFTEGPRSGLGRWFYKWFEGQAGPFIRDEEGRGAGTGARARMRWEGRGGTTGPLPLVVGRDRSTRRQTLRAS